MHSVDRLFSKSIFVVKYLVSFLISSILSRNFGTQGHSSIPYCLKVKSVDDHGFNDNLSKLLEIFDFVIICNVFAYKTDSSKFNVNDFN